MKYIFHLFIILTFLLSSCTKDQQSLPDEVNISGKLVTQVNTPDGISEELLTGLSLKLMMDGEVIQTTNNATFQFENLEPGRNYTLVPAKQDDQLEGVSENDIALLEDYIEGNSNLNIIQLVAADMDKDLIVNQDDLVVLKECIQTPMMQYCLDWRFVHEDCESLTQGRFINKIHFENLANDQLDFKIYAKRSGDLTE